MDERKNIVLIGFMGCGKTTLGKKLSIKLKYSFMDTDRYIERKEGMSISQIFEEKGESYFRDLEKNTVEILSKEVGNIIATGGGIIKNEQNMHMLKETGIIVYLKATPEHIFRNIANDDTRPLLQGEDKLEKIRILMEERRELYEKYADVTVDVFPGDVNQITERIERKLERYNEKGMHNTRPKS
ncbi:MAG: shikimate kinase [Lachnospiraceae bacterium]|nr:shikimate kinase [Lachnospiraceae bacterium]